VFGIITKIDAHRAVQEGMMFKFFKIILLKYKQLIILKHLLVTIALVAAYYYQISKSYSLHDKFLPNLVNAKIVWSHNLHIYNRGVF